MSIVTWVLDHTYCVGWLLDGDVHRPVLKHVAFPARAMIVHEVDVLIAKGEYVGATEAELRMGETGFQLPEPAGTHEVRSYEDLLALSGAE